MDRRWINTAVILGFAAMTVAAYADQVNSNKDIKTTNQDGESTKRSSRTKLGLNEGVVEEIDKENRSIIINHGHIKSKTVEMGPMTMPFSVAKASLQKAVKVGDKVKFNVENVNGMPTITAMKKQR